MKTINAEIYNAIVEGICDEFGSYDQEAIFNAIEYILGITDECEYNATLRVVNRVLGIEEEEDDCEFELVHDPNDYEYTPEEAEMLGLKWDPVLKMYI